MGILLVFTLFFDNSELYEVVFIIETINRVFEINFQVGVLIFHSGDQGASIVELSRLKVATLFFLSVIWRAHWACHRSRHGLVWYSWLMTPLG